MDDEEDEGTLFNQWYQEEDVSIGCEGGLSFLVASSVTL
jgi:hypothetical protein